VNFKEFLVVEAVYRGNIAMMETFRFFEIATPQQKKDYKDLLAAGKKLEALKMIEDVLGIKLQKVKPKTKLIPKRVPDGYNDGKWVWAVIEKFEDGDERTVESGFGSKKDAEFWIKNNS
jgi:hypothetical protein